MEWINLKQEKPEAGIEVLLFNENWINEDFNPKGIRIGFYDDVSGWVSAYWCNYHDDYHTRTSDEDDKQFEDYKAENQVPTHWMNIKPCDRNIVDTCEKQCIIPAVSNLVCCICKNQLTYFEIEKNICTNCGNSPCPITK